MEPIKEQMKFIEKTLNNNEPPRCVDGRPDKNSPQGPQMLGGSLHPLVLQAIIVNGEFNESAVIDGLKVLSDEKFVTGVHRGHHKNAEEGISDCGFGDKLKKILFKAQQNRTEITKRLESVYKKEGINNINNLSRSYDLISSYDLNKIKITGEELISKAEENNATTENLEGDHKEQVAFVNLRQDTTLDTVGLNSEGKQAFNLDLWAAIEQSMAITKGTSVNTLRDLSLILYQATEMVLVEDKGKPALHVIFHK